MDFDAQQRADIARIDAALAACLPPAQGPQARLFEAMRYSVLAPGKRVRPMLTLAFCRACGGRAEDALPFACAVELVHTYSLIHDDLPCMDDDDLRRGRPSCHAQFDEATALLAGDALLSLAFETSLCNNEQSVLSPAARARGACLLAAASGGNGMAGGQMIDLLSEGKEIPLPLLETMHRGKTGAMIRAAAVMGCVAAGADEQKERAADEYAARLGLAFQVVDDMLDVTGDTAMLGKPAGSDEGNLKSTYVTHLGLNGAGTLARRLSQEAADCLRVFGGEAAFLQELAARLLRRTH